MATCIFAALLRKDTANADRSVTISGSSIFYTSGDAAVWAHEEKYVKSGSEQEDDETDYDALSEYYSMFVFKEGTDAVNYRKHLAYRWVYNTAEEVSVDSKDDKTEEGEEEDKEITPASITPKAGWFSMEIGFESYSFKKFVITFESQQYVQTKDGKTTNYVMFYPNEEKTGVQVVISGNIEDAPEETAAVLSGHITIEFVADSNADPDEYAIGINHGVYNVKVSDTSGKETTGTFENVGYTYARYSSSTTTPVTPLSFKAEFEEKDEDSDGETLDNDYARMVLYRLNGQSFRIGTYRKLERDDEGKLKVEDFEKNYRKYYVLEGREYVRNTDEQPVDGKDYFTYTHGTTEESGHRRGGTINDNAPPVICFTNGISHIGVGKELPFDYQLIDVLASSPSADTYYYMLTTEQVLNNEFKPDNYADKNLFRFVTDSDNQYMEPHKNHYAPQESDIPEVYDDENFKVVAAVKVYLKLYDTRTDSINQTTYVLLDWFVKEDNLVKVNNNKYIAVANDEAGVAFAYTHKTVDDSGEEVVVSEPESQSWERLVKSYQKLVTEAAEDLKAGSKNYFYLPSFEDIPDYESGESLGNLFKDNVTAYTDLSYNVYYNNGSNGNTTSQKSNSLSINLTKEGRYGFTIYATDGSSNPMYYYKDGEKKTYTASNIWSMRESKKNTEYDDTKKYLPWFTFNVESSEIEIEDPGEREAAYVGTKYSAISFDINAVSFDRKYELYRFDNDVYFNDAKGGNGKALTYDEFMEKKADLLENNPQWFTEIPAASSLTKGSDEYDEFYKYGWNNTSPEFVPQDANTFYVVKLTVTSTVNNLEPKTAYMGISASAKISALKGEDTWLQDNMTSIILLAIAGASLIGIVLLLVIKPKNKGDIDEQFEEAKIKEKSKKKSK